MNDITPKEAIANLNHLYGMVAPDIQRSLDVAIKALERPQGEYKTACNVLLSLEQIVRSSDGWEDSAVEAVHNAVQTAIKCMHDRPKGEWIKVKEERMSVDMSGEIVTRYKCSKCERVIATFPSKLVDYYPFCHCGAKMKGGAE